MNPTGKLVPLTLLLLSALLAGTSGAAPNEELRVKIEEWVDALRFILFQLTRWLRFTQNCPL